MHHALTDKINTLLFDELAMSAPLPGNDGAGLDMVSYQRPALFQSVARTKGEPKPKMENQKPANCMENQNGEPKTKMKNQKPKEDQKSKWRTKNQNGEPKTKNGRTENQKLTNGEPKTKWRTKNQCWRTKNQKPT